MRCIFAILVGSLIFSAILDDQSNGAVSVADREVIASPTVRPVTPVSVVPVTSPVEVYHPRNDVVEVKKPTVAVTKSVTPVAKANVQQNGFFRSGRVGLFGRFRGFFGRFSGRSSSSGSRSACSSCS